MSQIEFHTISHLTSNYISEAEQLIRAVKELTKEERNKLLQAWNEREKELRYERCG